MTINSNYNVNTIILKQYSSKVSADTPSQLSFKGAEELLPKAFAFFESRPVYALTVIDIMGMVLPRTLIDLNRNKEELGHYNWDAGRETALRELSGTGVNFFLPGLIFTFLGNKLLDSKLNPESINTRASTNYATLDNFNNHLKHLVANLKNNSKDCVINVNELRKAFAERILSSASSTYEGKQIERGNIKKVVDQVEKTFNQANAKLSENLNARKSAIKAGEKSMAEFTVKMSRAIEPDLLDDFEMTVKGVTGEKSLKTTAKKLVGEDMFFFTDDIIAKAANGAEKINASQLLQKTDTLLNSLKTIKVFKVVIPFASALGLGFLYPKAQNWMTKRLNHGKTEFPGVAGLKNNKTEIRNSDVCNINLNFNNSKNHIPSKIFEAFEGKAV